MQGGDGEQGGLRARKRQQTRTRILEAALSLFLERGFEAVTVEEIAAAADISKRSFFDYFPTKEEVVFAWQEDFGTRLAAALAARPADEEPARAVEEAMLAAALAGANPRSMAIGRLIRITPALCARDHLKYARLEQVLATGLAARAGTEETLEIRLLAMMTIGLFRLGTVRYMQDGGDQPIEPYVRRLFQTLRTVGHGL